MDLFKVNKPKPGEIGSEDLFKITDLYFKRYGVLFKHLTDSYDYFLEEYLPEFFKKGDHVLYASISQTGVYKRHRLVFENIRIVSPTLRNSNIPMFPQDARFSSETYECTIISDIRQIVETYDTNSTSKIIEIKTVSQETRAIAQIPLMVGSKYCNMIQYPDLIDHKDPPRAGTKNKRCIERTNNQYDQYGYFILSGAEKALICQDRIAENKLLVFKKFKKGITHIIQLNSRSDKTHVQPQSVSIRLKETYDITLNILSLRDVNLFIVIKALGLETEDEIVGYVTHGETNLILHDKLRTSMSFCDEKGTKIVTKEQAQKFLALNLKRNTEDVRPMEEQMNDRMLQLRDILNNGFLPHFEGNLREKAIYLTIAVRKILLVRMGLIPADDRDSYINKRVDGPGQLISEITFQQYKKLMKELRRQFGQKKDKDNHSIIGSIKANIIKQGVNSAITKGSWPRKKGVSQMFNRTTFLLSLSTLRRVDASGGDGSGSKLVDPRKYTCSSVGFICPVQTPEHTKVGLTKSLSLIATLTNYNKDSHSIVKNFIKLYDGLVSLGELGNYNKLKNHYIVYLNGCPMGCLPGLSKTKGEKPLAIQFLLKIKEEKTKGAFNKESISCCIDHFNLAINIYSCAGRLSRIVLPVKDNKLVITKQDLDEIHKFKTWEEFMFSKPGIVEYLDVEEQFYSLLCPDYYSLEEANQKMLVAKSTIFTDDEKTAPNRYDISSYVTYSHCEIHPSLILGEASSSVPYLSWNTGIRAIYAFAQSKHGIGIYSSDYRYRCDNSLVLYQPSRPLVMTRTARYTYADIFPAGQTIIVAFTVYGGDNQEDSVYINKDSCDKGLLALKTLRKINIKTSKNTAGSDSDIFRKPDTNITKSRTKHFSKMTMQGYVPEETELVNNDAICSKIKQITKKGKNATYKDETEVYKSIAPGKVDRTWIGIQDNEGYIQNKIVTRSEREVRIGDKFASRFGQKGVIGGTINARDMPCTKEGIRPDLIFNPHSLVTRLTAGHMKEALMSLLATYIGHILDGTSFERYDEEEVTKIMEQVGLENKGLQTFYCGSTGEKMQYLIFNAPMFYQRLKHMALDKIHSRGRGKRSAITRQPNEGKSREGGHRLGEMERDSLLAHGTVMFLIEKLMDNSDQYICRICDLCGCIAQKEKTAKGKRKSGSYVCVKCVNNSAISMVRYPYTLKLLSQLLFMLKAKWQWITKNSMF